jgi:4'-phosphopantetheinyl transferase
VRVWTLRPDQLLAAHGEAPLLALLTDDERARRLTFHLDPDRDAFLASRVLVRCALAAETGVDPRRWRFGRDGNGKPIVAEPAQPDLEFNISHTRRLVACAWTRGTPVGVDVEDLTRPVDFDRIARRFFDAAEADDVEAAAAGPAKARRFFRYWTIKEAFVKARGEGIARLPFHAFRVVPAGHPAALAAVDAALHDDPAAWTFAEAEPEPQHLLAVAVRCRPDRAVFAVSQAPDDVVARLIGGG